MEVIKGTQDVYTHVTLIKKWDICSGDAILRAIGGKQTDLSGKDINYDHSLDPKMPGGLIATIHDHEKYRTALQKFAQKSKWIVDDNDILLYYFVILFLVLSLFIAKLKVLLVNKSV